MEIGKAFKGLETLKTPRGQFKSIMRVISQFRVCNFKMLRSQIRVARDALNFYSPPDKENNSSKFLFVLNFHFPLFCAPLTTPCGNKPPRRGEKSIHKIRTGSNCYGKNDRIYSSKPCFTREKFQFFWLNVF